MPKIFISFSKQDDNKKDAIKRRIENLGNDFEYLPVVDKVSIGTELRDKVKKALDDADYVIPIITKNSVMNQWVNQEIGYSIAAKGKNKVFPIIASTVLQDLKGFFIKDEEHFIFNDDTNKKKEANRFGRKCDELLDFLVRINKKDFDLSGFWQRQVTQYTPATDISSRVHIYHNTVLSFICLLNDPNQEFRFYLKVVDMVSNNWKWFAITNSSIKANETREFSHNIKKQPNKLEYKLQININKIIESDPMSSITGNQLIVDTIRLRGDKTIQKPITYYFKLEEE